MHSDSELKASYIELCGTLFNWVQCFCGLLGEPWTGTLPFSSTKDNEPRPGMVTSCSKLCYKRDEGFIPCDEDHLSPWCFLGPCWPRATGSKAQSWCPWDPLIPMMLHSDMPRNNQSTVRELDNIRGGGKHCWILMQDIWSHCKPQDYAIFWEKKKQKQKQNQTNQNPFYGVAHP